LPHIPPGPPNSTIRWGHSIRRCHHLRTPRWNRCRRNAPHELRQHDQAENPHTLFGSEPVGANHDPGIEFAPDSLLERDGFRLPVPSASHETVNRQRRRDCCLGKGERIWCGTEGSNPSPSSKESPANLISGARPCARPHRRRRCQRVPLAASPRRLLRMTHGVAWFLSVRPMRHGSATSTVTNAAGWSTPAPSHCAPLCAAHSTPALVRRDRREAPVIGGHYLKSLAAGPPKISALIVAIGSKIPPARGTISRCRRCNAISVERCPMETIVVFGRTSISIR